MSGCWPVVKAAVALVHRPVSHGVHHVVHRVAARHAARRAMHAAAPPVRPDALSGACAKAPGALPAGPGGFTGLASVAGKAAAMVATGVAVASGAAMFRADTDGVHISQNDPAAGVAGLGNPAPMAAAPAFVGLATGAATVPEPASGDAPRMMAPAAPGLSASVSGGAPVARLPSADKAARPAVVQHVAVQPLTGSLAIRAGVELIPPSDIQSGETGATELPEPSCAIIFAFAAVTAMLLHRLGRVA